MFVLPGEPLQPPGQYEGGQRGQTNHPQTETGHRAAWQGLGVRAGAGESTSTITSTSTNTVAVAVAVADGCRCRGRR